MSSDRSRGISVSAIEPPSIGGLQLGSGSACPVVVPSVPGYVAKKSLKLRFSWIMRTTCWIGVAERPDAEYNLISPGAGDGWEPVPQPAISTAATARKANTVTRMDIQSSPLWFHGE